MSHVLFRAGVMLAVIVAASPARAQLDIAGEWAATFHEDLPHRGGMRLGDFTGLPLNESGIRKGQAWDEAARSMRERQCVPHVVTYAMRGPASIRFSRMADPDTGQLIAYTMQGTYGRPRTIWMDGRPHPSDLAPHSWVGFSTGRWERNTLVVTTTHVKAGWLQRNGSPTSDLTTMTEFFTKYDDNLLVVHVLRDPVYLAEPFIRSTNFSANPAGNANAWGTCSPAQVVDELPDRRTGFVPHYLPGETEHIDDFIEDTGLPPAGVRGGAHTLYPEFARTLASGGEAAAVSTDIEGPGDRVREALPVFTGEVRVEQVQGNVHLIAGAGGNIVAQVGPQGVVLVDTGSGERTDQVLAAVRRLSDQPIRYILNTHAHGDHTGGNAALQKAGSRMGGGLVVAGPTGTGASILAHEGVLFDMSAPGGKPAPGPVDGLPTSAYVGQQQDAFLNGEAIQLLHQPNAHTDGDSIVFFRRSDVIVTGGIFDITRYPVVDGANGGTVGGLLDALNRIIDLAVPEDWQDGGTLVVPGHGRIADESDLVEYRDMVTIVRDRVRALVDRGMSLDQIRAARPTYEYDRRYGSASGEWTTEMFLEAVYRDVVAKR